MQNRNAPINIDVMEDELSAHEWGMNNLVWELYWWVDLFNMVFFKDQSVPIPTLTFEKTRVNNLGFYRIGFNDYTIKDQINLNRLYIERPLNEVLQTLIHEMVHSWEFIYVPEDKRTKSWYHTEAFRMKISQIGILTNNKGCHMGIGDPFIHLLRQHAVEFQRTHRDSKGFIMISPKTTPKGKSKLRKWKCPCGQNARIGRSEFHATCNICNGKFELAY